jgi:hypothetical protein
MQHASSTTRIAKKFPDGASLSTSFSKVKSATARRSLPFSCSSSFRRFT